MYLSFIFHSVKKITFYFIIIIQLGVSVLGRRCNEALHVLQVRHAGCELLGPHAEVALCECGLRLKHVIVHGFGLGCGVNIDLLGALNELQVGQHAFVN